MTAQGRTKWTKQQRNVVFASYPRLDARRVRLLPAGVRAQGHRDANSTPTIASGDLRMFLTLAMRPVGALAVRPRRRPFGRRPMLMVDVLLYSALEFASGFAPNLMVLLVLRSLFGVAMGGEWGVGASLALETIPPKARGLVSGILQAGYPRAICWPRSSMPALSAHRLARHVHGRRRCRRCWCSTSAARCRNRRAWQRRGGAANAEHAGRAEARTGGSCSTPSC